MKGLWKHKNGIFYIRKRIPPDIKSKDSANEVLFSLLTSNQKEAETIASSLLNFYCELVIICRRHRGKIMWRKPNKTKLGENLQMNFMASLTIGDLEFKIEGKEEEKETIQEILSNTIKTVGFQKNDIKEPNHIQKISDFIVPYLEEVKLQNLRGATTNEKERHIKKFLEFLGNEATLDKLEPNNCKSYINFIFKSDHSYITKTKLVNNPKGFVKWLWNNSYIENFPFERLTIPKKPKSFEDNSYKNFDKEDFKKIFSDELIKDSRKYASNYWLPVLGAFTGARINELGQLKLSDFHLNEDIPYIDINAEDNKYVKNKSSIRKIPLHPILFELGLGKYLKQLKSEKCEFFCSDCANKSMSPDKIRQRLTDRFGRYKRKIGLTDDKKVFHSFRHTFISELQLKEVPLEIRQSIAGHTPQNITTAVYGTKSSLQQMYDAIKLIDYGQKIPLFEFTLKQIKQRSIQQRGS